MLDMITTSLQKRYFHHTACPLLVKPAGAKTESKPLFVEICTCGMPKIVFKSAAKAGGPHGAALPFSFWEGKKMKEMKTTAQVLVDCLEAEGVDVMFGIPGEETLDLMFASGQQDTLHPGAPRAGCGLYGGCLWPSDRPGRRLPVHPWPGAPTLSPVWRMSYLDGAPLVAITGQVGTDGCSSPATSTLT